METFAELLATGDTAWLVLALLAFAVGGLLMAVAVRMRPRRGRIAR